MLSIILKVTEIEFDWSDAMAVSVGILFVVGIVAGELYWLCHWGSILCIIIALISFVSFSALLCLFMDDWHDAIEMTGIIFFIGVVGVGAIIVLGGPFLENKPPEASILVYPTKVEMGKNVTFSGVCSRDPDGNITHYKWDFGDECTASGASVSHAYSDTGTYNITLTVIDNDNESSKDIGEVNVVEKTFATIKLVVSSESWVVGEPYYIPGELCYIYDSAKQKLEAVNFSVVPEKCEIYDFILDISYKEEKDESAVYVPTGWDWFPDWLTPHYYGTDITCDLKLYDKANNLLLKKHLYAETTSESVMSYQSYATEELRDDAIRNLKSKYDFIHLGEMVASKLEVKEFEKE